MDIELIHKPGRENLVSDALKCREEFITPLLLVLVEENLDEFENDFLDNVQEAIKHDEDAVINNRFFDERGWKKIHREAGE